MATPKPSQFRVDASERADVERYLRYQRFLTDVGQAIQHADAIQRLELRLKNSN